MGVSYRSITGLPQPFLLFDERIVESPPGSVLTNRSAAEFKTIILLTGEFLQQVDPKLPAAAGSLRRHVLESTSKR